MENKREFNKEQKLPYLKHDKSNTENEQEPKSTCTNEQTKKMYFLSWVP